MKTAVDLEFNPSPSVIRTARDSASALASQLEPGTLDDLRLLVSELVTNSVRHAGLLSDDWIRVHLSIGGGRVRGEISDSGSGFEPPATPEPLAESGWGMYLLERIADRWGVERNDETCVWFEIDV
jgi:anti-sigma regulatory factor (Ser/Thr protein kinase)